MTRAEVEVADEGEDEREEDAAAEGRVKGRKGYGRLGASAEFSSLLAPHNHRECLH